MFGCPENLSATISARARTRGKKKEKDEFLNRTFSILATKMIIDCLLYFFIIIIIIIPRLNDKRKKEYIFLVFPIDHNL